MSTLAFEPLCVVEEPLRDPAAAMPCFPFAAPTVEREMGAQCRVPTAEECGGGKSPAEAQSDVGGRSLEMAASGESGEIADELLLLDWIIDASCSTDDLTLHRTATADSRSAGANDSFASPSPGIRGNLSHSPLRASASDRNLGGLCGDSRGGKREFRRSCSMEDINSGGASGGGGRGGKPGNRIHLESSPSSVLTGGPTSPATSVDSCASDLASPISSPVITERISIAKPRTLHLPPLPPKAPVVSDSTWRTIPAISGPASCAPPTVQIQPLHQIRSFGAPQHAVPSALSPRLQQQQRESQQGQLAQAAAKQHPLLALDEQRRKHRAWLSLFSPSLAQTLPPLAPSESGAELKRLAELRAQTTSTAHAEAEAEQRAEGDCAREINAAAEVAVSAFCAEFPPFSIPAANDGQPGVTSGWVANGNPSDELAGDVTQAIRQGLGSLKLGTAAGSSSGQQQNFSRSFSYDVTSQAGGLPNRNTSGIRRTSSDVGEAPANPHNVHVTRSGTCVNGAVILTKPSNLRRGGMAKQVQGQKKVSWGADEVFEIPARCSSIDF